MNIKTTGVSRRGVLRGLFVFAMGMAALFFSCLSGGDGNKNTNSSKTDDGEMSNKKRLPGYLKDNYGSALFLARWARHGQPMRLWIVARVFAGTGKYPAIIGFDFIQLPYDGGGEQSAETIEWWNGKNNGKTAFRIPYRNGTLDASSSDFTRIKNDWIRLPRGFRN
ncbi:MAG: hypothetical protein LBG43_00415 [Treponema sp.]|jgi:hypothetical protein|nr:hypothetical protein [Treponema sp.]